jgi:tetratricopeptide (TPR) repeat protein
MLLGTASPRDATYAQQRQAVEMLKPFVAEHPDHPGIAHYLIHSLDYPELANLALDAARRYARIAPSSAHALHMPSHIFVRLGLWPESIASNLDSAGSAIKNRTLFPVASSFDELHALDYLEYAYLQTGQDALASEIAERAAKLAGVEQKNFAADYALGAIPTRYRLERGDWRGAAELVEPLAAGAVAAYPYAAAIPVYGRAIGAARSGGLARAEQAIARLAEIQRALVASPPPGVYDWAGHVEATRLAAAGLLARAKSENDEAVRLLTEAAELDHKVGKNPVTPGTVLPPRELLAEVLLELGRADEALAAFEEVLVEAPNRLRALSGAARAAELARQPERARTLYTLVASVAAPDSQRPEVAKARAKLQSR